MSQLNETMTPLMNKLDSDEDNDDEQDDADKDDEMEELDLSKLNDQEKKQFCELVYST